MIEKIQVADNVALAVDAAPASDAPVLVLSSSIGADMHMWDEVVPLLSSCFRIVRYDTRGHGSSDIGSGPVTIENLGNDVIAILDHLNISRAFLCGLSLGGLTAQWLALHHADRFAGVILANTAPNFPPASMWHDRAKTVREQGMQPLVAATLDRWLTKSFRESHPDRVAEVSKMIAGTSPEGYALCCEVLARTDLSDKLGAVRIPVRVICGEHDPSTTPLRGKELVDRIALADMITIPAAHISAIEAPEQFADGVLEFVSRHASERQS